MREILFRGKRKDNGEWVYGSLIALDNDNEFVYICPKYEYASSMTISELISCCLCSVDPETVGQYTGLTDKNGNKIFEGDILKCLTDDFVGTVIYNKNTASFIVEIKNSNSEFFHYSSLNKGDITRPLQLQETESVGNIHDNAELLEMQDD